MIHYVIHTISLIFIICLLYKHLLKINNKPKEKPKEKPEENFKKLAMDFHYKYKCANYSYNDFKLINYYYDNGENSDFIILEIKYLKTNEVLRFYFRIILSYIYTSGERCCSDFTEVLKKFRNEIEFKEKEKIILRNNLK